MMCTSELVELTKLANNDCGSYIFHQKMPSLLKPRQIHTPTTGTCTSNNTNSNYLQVEYGYHSSLRDSHDQRYKYILVAYYFSKWGEAILM